MQKDMIIFLGSIQNDGTADGGRIEVITAGSYYYKNGKHYIIYEELPEDGGPVIKNVIKIHEGMTEIIKSGDAGARMVFEENKRHVSYYETAFGKILVGIRTSQILVEEEEDRLQVHLEYRLEMESAHVTDCVVDIRIESKETCKIDLTGR